MSAREQAEGWQWLSTLPQTQLSALLRLCLSAETGLWFQDEGVSLLPWSVDDAVVSIIGSLGIDPFFPFSLKGVVLLEFRPEFRKVVDTFKRLCLTAFEDALPEFTIER